MFCSFELRPLRDVVCQELTQLLRPPAAHVHAHRAAPGRFSITTGLLYLACILSATTRAVVSIEPPGAVGTMMRTVRSGKACAPPLAQMAATSRAPPARAHRSISSPPPAASAADRQQMLVEHRRHGGGRQTAKAAIGRHAEIGQIFLRQRDALPEALHVMDDPEIDARAPRLQVLERREKRVVGAIEHGNMDPVDPPP